MRIFFLISLIFSSSFCFAEPTPTPAPAPTPAQVQATPQAEDGKTTQVESSILGRWESSFRNKTLYMEFHDNGDLSLGEGEMSMKGTYKVDFTQTPHHLDMTFEGQTKKAIFEFVKEGVRLSEPKKERPTNFDDGDALVFKKTK